jgi:hypothetical protein
VVGWGHFFSHITDKYLLFLFHYPAVKHVHFCISISVAKVQRKYQEEPNNHNMKMKLLLVIAGAMMLTITTVAQTVYKRSDYKKHPVWIQMMNDTTANYFETVKAFREFFKDRVLPKEPFELEGSDAFEREVGLEKEGKTGESEKEKKREKAKINPAEQDYSAEVRAFKGWFYSVKPNVRSDGRIIGPAERQSIIDRQQKELKEVEKANRK